MRSRRLEPSEDFVWSAMQSLMMALLIKPAYANFASRTTLLTAAALTIALVFHRADGWWNTLQKAGALILIAAGLAIALVLAYFAVRASAVLVRRAAGEIALVGVVLVIAEIMVLNWIPGTWTASRGVQKQLTMETAARKLSIPVDRRTTSEVVLDLRAEGADALPGISRAWSRTAHMRAQLNPGFYPLSHASHAQIVECNESGTYLIYGTDEFGFNNPPGLVAGGKIDVAVVGESHTLGHCVPAGRGFVDVIRSAIPRTANFAMSYTLSLTQLGSLREYVEPLQPPVVLWVVNPALAVVMGDEENHPVLQRYLDPSFSQNLMARQSEVDEAVRSWARVLQDELDRDLRTEIGQAKAKRLAKFYSLGEVRSGLDLGRMWRRGPPRPNMTLFEQSLRVAQNAVEGWGGQFIVMVLPAYGELMGEKKEVARRMAVLDVARRLDIQVIDAAAWFLAQPDVTRLYALRMANHPNEAGHALLGTRVAEQLKMHLSLLNRRGSQSLPPPGRDSESLSSFNRPDGEGQS